MAGENGPVGKIPVGVTAVVMTNAHSVDAFARVGTGI